MGRTGRRAEGWQRDGRGMAEHAGACQSMSINRGEQAEEGGGEERQRLGTGWIKIGPSMMRGSSGSDVSSHARLPSMPSLSLDRGLRSILSSPSPPSCQRIDLPSPFFARYRRPFTIRPADDDSEP